MNQAALPSPPSCRHSVVAHAPTLTVSSTSGASTWRGIPQLHQLPALPPAVHGTRRLTPLIGIATLAPMVTACLPMQSFSLSETAVPSVAAEDGVHPIMDISSSPPALIPWSFPLSVSATTRTVRCTARVRAGVIGRQLRMVLATRTTCTSAAVI